MQVIDQAQQIPRSGHARRHIQDAFGNIGDTPKLCAAARQDDACRKQSVIS
jgi:hypothetical protein